MPSPEKPRIAVCLEYSILAFGGTEVLVAELVRGLSAEFAITLVSADRSLERTWVAPHLAEHLAWPLAGGRQELAARLQASGVQLAHFHLGESYAWGSRRLGASPILRVRAAGIPCLTTNHGFFSPLEGYCAQYRPLWMKLALFPAAWLARLQILLALECEVAVSRHDQRELRRWFRPVRDRFRQIYHSQLPRELEVPTIARVQRVLCVGTFGRRKGQPLLVEAFGRVAARFPEWQLLFAGRIGEADVWAEAEERIAAHGLAHRVRRVEGLSHPEIAELMRTSEIFVLPSVFEGLGLSLQEALYHGCASLSTRSGGPEDLIEPEENGLLVENENPQALADALARLMADAPLRERLRARGPASVAQRGMNAEAMLEAYRGLYRELLGK